MNKNRYILFDLDGTLCDPIEGITSSINHALVKFGYSSYSNTYLSQFIGPPLEHIFTHLSDSATEDEIKQMIDAYRTHYNSEGYKATSIYPGVKEVLADMQAARIPMAVCTLKKTNIASKILTMFEIDRYFDFVSGRDHEPNKTVQVSNLLAKNTITAQSILVGDRGSDLSAAKSNHLTAVGVLWGYGSLSELNQEEPQILLQTPNQLEELIVFYTKPVAV